MAEEPETEVVELQADDLVPDRALVTDDRDAFNYEAVADRLADLVANGDTPLNIALFGPWGSGKSSVCELLDRSLATKHPDIKLVRYDAWKFGGDSLQRNFISHAATKLGFEDDSDAEANKRGDNREFHRGLYEKQRRAEVDFEQLKLRSRGVPLLFVLTFIGFLLAFCIVAGAASIFTEKDFLGQIAKSLPQVIAPTGVIAVFLAAAKGLLDGATVDIEQSQPAAEEEFARTFERLVKRARDNKHKRRLAFFIDELDRCSAEDVVKTLQAVRTFLDIRDCVFIVAADREVLERALTELPQPTPTNETSPYYSSASSFLDKVFQHQIPLPPLRGRRLTRFARDLVRERGGLWAELRELEEDDRAVDRVI